jgi:hypothetical protein
MDKDDDPVEKRFRGVMFGVGDFSIDPEHLAEAMVDFGPGIEEIVDNAINSAKAWKEDIVANGPEDIPDQCVAVLPQGTFYCPIEQMCYGMNIRPPEAMAISLHSLSQVLGKPIAVLTLVETLGEKVASEEEVREHVAGALAERWHAGDRENLFESLSICIATPTFFVTVFMPYHYGDGSVIWDEQRRDDEPDWLDDELASNMKQAIAMAWQEPDSEEGGTDGTE